MPRTIIISFLGDSTYKIANYYYADINQSHSSQYFLLAVHKFFSDTPIDMTYVVLTEEARKAHWDGDNQENLRHQLLKIEKPFDEIDIPSIQSTEGLWTMFSAIEQKIQEGDQIIFDITNSWRSQPVVALLIISFVKITKHAKIKTLIYGSFDIKKKEEPQPVYNLTSMATLLDWTTAVSTFQQTGRVENLAALTTDLGGKPAEKFAKQLEAFSQELLAARPVGTAWTVSKLPELLAAVKNDSRPESKPLGLLLDSIESTFSLFQLKSVKFDKFDTAYNRIQSQSREQDFLRMQLKMIDWYINKDLPIQAINLTREWLITLVAYIKKLDIFDRNQRDEARDFIFKSDYEIIDIVNIWKQVGNIEPNKRLTGDIRNDVAHCGMDKNNNRTIQKIIREIKDIYSRLHKLLSNQP